MSMKKDKHFIIGYTRIQIPDMIPISGRIIPPETKVLNVKEDVGIKPKK